ncbi:MAG: M15 family metallopeptidase, partial [Epsilonproteobacteria bacterium]|nr:M15 family metallopeptidase [Campylobacterota bacterium]
KFFKILYGKNKKEIKKNLTQVIWLPKNENKILWFNKLQNAAKNLQKVSNELDKLPKIYKKYIINIGGTFKYRKISGTNRLSAHSFGIAIDINTKLSNYWKWDKNRVYKNKIPKKIVDIFERNGFIWGGRWFHYDTMHFEYRPELARKTSKDKL